MYTACPEVAYADRRNSTSRKIGGPATQFFGTRPDRCIQDWESLTRNQLLNWRVAKHASSRQRQVGHQRPAPAATGATELVLKGAALEELDGLLCAASHTIEGDAEHTDLVFCFR